MPQGTSIRPFEDNGQKQARNFRVFLTFFCAYGVVVFILSGASTEQFEHLHLVLDTSNGILSLLLAMFLMAEQHRIQPNLRKYLVVGFSFAAATEILHALIGIEWTGSMSWVATYSSTLRPATWPPSAYVLPLGLAWTLWLTRRGAPMRPIMFAAGMAVLALCLYALSMKLPKYVDTGILGIQRPTQAPLLLLLAIVIAAYWRERGAHPLFQGIALMGVLLFLSDLCMLYSTSPHEKFTMMAHAGKFFAYTFLHTIQMSLAADESRARAAAEASLVVEQERLRGTLDELKHQKFALDQHAIVSTTDVQGNITYANQWFCDISGYTRDELIGQNHRMLKSGVHGEEFFRDLYRTIASGEVWRGEICNRAKDGHLYWVAATIVPFKDERGRPSQYISIRSDITARKRADQDLQAAKEAAEAANRSKSAFLATMSHEIRTPLNGVLGMAQLLLMSGISEEERREYARTILNSGQTLLALLNDILDLSKVEAGKIELARVAFEPTQLLDETLALFVDLGRAKGLNVESRWRDPGGQRYWADSVRLRQMLSNLVSNAIKFTPRGFVRVEGYEVERDERAAVLEFSVSDSGIGVPAQMQTLLFKPFSQIDNTSTREYGGTGLGLSIVRSLANLMGGDVGVESEPGSGSRFWFRIRVDFLRENDEDSRSANRAAAERTMASASRSAPRVLVVEDDRTNCIVIEALLGKCGVRVENVENGQQAVDVITRGARPDLVLMDVQMPVMDGIEATKRIRLWEHEARQPRLPIVALTAGVFADDRQQCIACGMDGFLAKPVNVDDLMSILAHWLERKTEIRDGIDLSH